MAIKNGSKFVFMLPLCSRFLYLLFRFFLCPYVLCQTKDRPALRPADIHGHMGNNGCHFLFCYPMTFCIFQMISKRRVCYAGCHQRYNRNDTLQFDGNCLFIPYLSEQHIIIQMCKHRCKISKAFPSCGLYNFFTHLVFLQSCKIFLLFFK